MKKQIIHGETTTEYMALGAGGGTIATEAARHDFRGKR